MTATVTIETIPSRVRGRQCSVGFSCRRPADRLVHLAAGEVWYACEGHANGVAGIAQAHGVTVAGA